MKKYLILFVLFFTSIGFSQEETIETPKILVKVSVGETVVFKGATVMFLTVVEDSRCPSDVHCIWEGQAIALVEVTEKGKEPQQVELLYGKRKNEVLFYSEGYSLKGMSLNPYPSSDTIGKMDYWLSVSEEEN